MRQIIFDIGSWVSISAGSSAYGILWHPRMRYDGHPGDGDFAVESRPHPLVGYSGSLPVFFIFRPSCKDIGHEFRRSSGKGFLALSLEEPFLSAIVILHASGITITACELGYSHAAY